MPTGLQYITQNPVSGAFDRRQLAEQEKRAAELAQADNEAIHAERLATSPHRVEQSGLKTASDQIANRHNKADANVAVQTVGSRTARSGALASEAMTRADVAAQSAPAAVRTNIGNAGVAEGNARLSNVNANVAEGTQLTKIFNANSARSLDILKLTITALKDGDIEGAKMLAASNGEEIPPEILTSKSLQMALVKYTELAEQYHPNSPKKQQKYIKSGMAGVLDEMARNGSLKPVSPETYAAIPAGAPAPAEVANTKAKQLPSDVEAAEWLAQNTADSEGRPVTPSDKVSAFEFIRQAKSDPNKQAEMVIRVAAPLLANRRDRRPVEEKIAEATKAVEDILATSQPSIESPNTPVQILPPAPVEMADRVVGQIYSARNGQKVLWDGKGWKVAP